MNLIHIETEHVQACANLLFAHADEVEQQAINILIVSRSADWYGTNRDYFQSEVEDIARELVRTCLDARTLALRALHSAENLQATDSLFAREYAVTP